jgi:hypothetical protein
LSSENREVTQVKFQVDSPPILTCDGATLIELLRAGQRWLEAHFTIVNAYNVFPVPDGDTGTNLVLTMRAAVEAVTTLSPQAGVGQVTQAAAKGVLLGARGNSGVIFAQFFQGFAANLASEEKATAKTVASALAAGATLAYQCVAQPIEGTLLTVMRATAEAARLQADTEPDLRALLTAMVEAAQIAQAKTPELLPLLKQAGVTDSGGLGFLYILQGAYRFMRGQSLFPSQVVPAGFVNGKNQAQLNGSSATGETYDYDVQFLIHQPRLEVPLLRAAFEKMGGSVLVVGTNKVVKVHLHTHEPSEPISYGVSQGAVGSLLVENMRQQAQFFAKGDQVGSIETRMEQVSIIAVVAGAGFVRLFQSLGVAYILSGAQLFEPTVAELVAVINQVPTQTVMILPNHEAAFLAAQEARRAVEKEVVVLPTRSLPQGLAALLRFDPHSDLALTIARMTEAANQVRMIQVGQISKPELKQSGLVVGWLDGVVVSQGPISQDVIVESLLQLNVEDFEIITLYYGQEIPAAAAEIVASQLAKRFPTVEIELHAGGQPDYYIVTLE